MARSPLKATAAGTTPLAGDSLGDRTETPTRELSGASFFGQAVKSKDSTRRMQLAGTMRLIVQRMPRLVEGYSVVNIEIVFETKC